MPAVQWGERTSFDVVLFANQDAACLAIRSRLQEQVFCFIERKSHMGERNWRGRWYVIGRSTRIGQSIRFLFQRSLFQTSCGLQQLVVSLSGFPIIGWIEI